MSQPGGGQYSPDGRWWWDGQRWVPVTGGSAAGAAIQRAFEPNRLVRRLIIGRLIGCAIGLAILAVVAIFVLGSLGISVLGVLHH